MQEKAAIFDVEDRVSKEQHTKLQQVCFAIAYVAPHCDGILVNLHVPGQPAWVHGCQVTIDRQSLSLITSQTKRCTLSVCQRQTLQVPPGRCAGCVAEHVLQRQAFLQRCQWAVQAYAKMEIECKQALKRAAAMEEDNARLAKELRIAKFLAAFDQSTVNGYRAQVKTMRALAARIAE